jgi:hypothetical protein
MLHRVFYALHVMMSFVMCVAIEHPDHKFFDYRYQAFFLTVSSIILRGFLVIMWSLYWYNDRAMRNNRALQSHLPKYSAEQVKRQVIVHGGSIFVAIVLLAVTCFTEYDGDPEDEVDNTASKRHQRRDLLASSSYGSGEDDDAKKERNHLDTIVLWILAVAVETLGNVFGSIYDTLPFSGEYAGERMQVRDSKKKRV